MSCHGNEAAPEVTTRGTADHNNSSSFSISDGTQLSSDCPPPPRGDPPMVGDAMTTAMLDAALAYIERGWPILPLLPRSKYPYSDLLPLVEGGHSWNPLRDGVSAREVQRWLKHDPRANIGIITGREMAAADVDEPGELHGLGFPVTPMARTGGPGRYHVYLDIRGLDVPERPYPWGHIKAGGYVVAPPSVHETGVTYEWYPFLSFDDLPLAAPSGALLREIQRQRETAPSININTGCSSETQGFPDLSEDWEVARRVLARCGADVQGLGKAFKCVLPGHEERRASAALWRPEDGYIGYHDFHGRGEGPWYTLADVYAAHHSGTTRKLGKGEGVVWWLRALADIGAIEVPEVPHHELPGDAPKSVRKMYAGFLRLLALRTVYDATQERSAPFTWTFAQGWCGIGSRHTVQDALNWLFKRGYVYRCGKTPRGVGLLALGKPRKVRG